MLYYFISADASARKATTGDAAKVTFLWNNASLLGAWIIEKRGENCTLLHASSGFNLEKTFHP